MKMHYAALLFAMSAGAAQAVTQNFDSYSGGTVLTGVDVGGFSLSSGGDPVQINSSVGFFGTGAFIETDPFSNASPFRADFLVSGVNSVSVDVGDANGDADDLFLFAYDSIGGLIDSFTTSIIASYVGFETLTVSGPNIAYVVFGGGSSAFPNSVYADNFSYTVATVPLPAGGLLLAGGLGLMGMARRRRRSA